MCALYDVNKGTKRDLCGMKRQQEAAYFHTVCFQERATRNSTTRANFVQESNAQRSHSTHGDFSAPSTGQYLDT